MRLPRGAEAVVEARKAGMRPDEMLIVSLVGRVGERNQTIFASPKVEYDWRWIHGLQVCIYAGQNTDWTETAKAIAKARPSYLGLWDADRKEGAQLWLLPHVADIEKPKCQWRWILDYLPWLPIQNLEFACN